MRPVLFELWSTPVYAYPFFIGISWAIAYKLIVKTLLKNKVPLTGFRSLFLMGSLCSWSGAKVFFLLHSSVNVWTSMKDPLFWLGGGMVFYGGFLFALAFLAVYSLVFKRFDFAQIHLFIPAICFAHAIGRIGCFFTGCCYGNYCRYFWSVTLHGTSRHPVQLYEAFCVFIIGLGSSHLIKKKVSWVWCVCFYFVGYGVIRFVLEFFRGDHIRGIYNMGLSASQYFSIGPLLVATILSLAQIKRPV